MNWIKMHASLCTNPKVLMIADRIARSAEASEALMHDRHALLQSTVTRDVTRDVTVASLLRVWSVTNDHTSDGVLKHSTLQTLDVFAGVPGFGDAMELVGWAVFDPKAVTVTLPNFEENNAPTKGAQRSAAAKRQAKYRESKHAKPSPSDAPQDLKSDVTRDVTRDVTVTRREEKRREDISKPDGLEVGREKRGSKQCPATFVVTEEMRQWAHTECPGVDVDRATAVFRDYTFKTALKDFNGAWRNWIRRDSQFSASPAGTKSVGAARGMSFAERDQALKRRNWEEMTGRKWPQNCEQFTGETIDAISLEIGNEPAK